MYKYNEVNIKYLVYQINQAIKNNLPKPIVFLGAGASKSGNIPLASEIIDTILNTFKDNPRIQGLCEEDHTYPKLMACLTPYDRNALLKQYIEAAKINVTHLYLAHLMNAGYIDYVLTVNFDNLMLRALALYNEFPPTYDLAVLKDLTTTTFKDKSVIYLHGQHHGLWLLNTEEEMKKVNAIIPPILNKISDKRPWIFIGYSGEDLIFDHIVKLGRFDNGLYWVTFKDNDPVNSVCEKLLTTNNTNAHVIKGYDSDTFMLTLSNGLGLDQPTVIEKPFTTLKNSLDNIVDIEEDDNYDGLKERLEIVKGWVDHAIDRYENGDNKICNETDLDRDHLKMRILSIISSQKFDGDDIESLKTQSDVLNDTEINELLSRLYTAWAMSIYKDNHQIDGDDYISCLEKIETAVSLNPTHMNAWIMWGVLLHNHGALKQDSSEVEKGIEKYNQATKFDENNYALILNLGHAQAKLGLLLEDENILCEACDKYQKAIDLKPEEQSTYYTKGTLLLKLAKITNNSKYIEEARDVCTIGFDKGGDSYNLACAHALLRNKERALHYLKNALDRKQIKPEFVNTDSDWDDYRVDIDFMNLIKSYPLVSPNQK